MADGVQFTEEQEFAKANIRPSLLVRLAYSTGLVQTEQGVQYLLLTVMGICVVASFYVLHSAFTTTTKLENPYQVGQSALVPPDSLQSYYQ